MTKEQQALVKSLDSVISQKKELEKLKNTKGWKILESALLELRRNALEDVLAGGGKKEESVFVRIGHAQAVNSIFNMLSQLVSEGKQAVMEKEALIKSIREGDRVVDEETRVQRYYGHEASL